MPGKIGGFMMKKNRVKTDRKRENTSNGRGKAPKRVLLFAALAAGAGLLVLLTVFLTRPKMLWYVDEEFSAAWRRVLQENPPPLKRFEIIPRQEPGGKDYDGEEDFPRGRFGFIVSKKGPQGELVPDTPVTVYNNL